jgi:hypothetical protein
VRARALLLIGFAAMLLVRLLGQTGRHSVGPDPSLVTLTCRRLCIAAAKTNLVWGKPLLASVAGHESDKSMQNGCFVNQECPDAFFMNGFHRLVECSLIGRKETANSCSIGLKSGLYAGR